MALGKELDDLLFQYDICHYCRLNENNVEVNFNFLKDKKVEFVLLCKNRLNIVSTYRCLFNLDFDFETRIFPRVLIHFISKNSDLDKKVIMGTDSSGTLNLFRKDGKESLILRNCSIKFINIVNSLNDSILSLNAIETRDINIKTEENEKYISFVSANIALCYAKYRSDFLDDSEKSDFFDFNTHKSLLNKENRNNEKKLKNLVSLDLVRYAYTLGINGSVWDEIIKEYNNDSLIVDLCNEFKLNSGDSKSLFFKAINCVEYEEINRYFITNNKVFIKEALEAAKYGVFSNSDKFLEYWDRKKRYYKILENNELVKVCNDFLISNRLVLFDVDSDAKKDTKKDVSVDLIRNKKDNLLSTLKDIKKNSRQDFSDIINNPIIVDNNSNFNSTNALVLGAKEQAKQLFQILKEHEQIKKDAEEFAKTILNGQREYKKIVKMAEEQAREIYNLECENRKLKKMAEETARYILENNKKYDEEIKLREEQDDVPIHKADIDKINYLLTALSNVKDLDFAVNHPTIMQTISLLEQKITTYLLTHKNIISYEDEEINNDEVIVQNKTSDELLNIIRNVYNASHIYQKDGRHTVINILPVDNFYHIVIYSVKDDNDDILTETFFDSSSFDDSVIKELCDIYSKNAVLVASKTDNIPNGFGDYLVIDDNDNAIKFMGCPIKVIEIAKKYL